MNFSDILNSQTDPLSGTNSIRRPVKKIRLKPSNFTQIIIFTLMFCSHNIHIDRSAWGSSVHNKKKYPQKIHLVVTALIIFHDYYASFHALP